MTIPKTVEVEPFQNEKGNNEHYMHQKNFAAGLFEGWRARGQQIFQIRTLVHMAIDPPVIYCHCHPNTFPQSNWFVVASRHNFQFNVVKCFLRKGSCAYHSILI